MSQVTLFASAGSNTAKKVRVAFAAMNQTVTVDGAMEKGADGKPISKLVVEGAELFSESDILTKVGTMQAEAMKQAVPVSEWVVKVLALDAACVEFDRANRGQGIPPALDSIAEEVAAILAASKESFLFGSSLSFADITLALSVHKYMTGKFAAAHRTDAPWMAFTQYCTRCYESEAFTATFAAPPKAAKVVKGAPAVVSEEVIPTPPAPAHVDLGIPSEFIFKNRKTVRQVIELGKTCSTEVASGTPVTVCGWARNVRAQAGLTFIELYDGTCAANLQVVVSGEVPGAELAASAALSASFHLEGTLIRCERGKHTCELQICDAQKHKIALLGPGASTTDYPLLAKNAPMEHIRAHPHLRPRDPRFAAVTRVRTQLAMATHDYFARLNDFQYIHTPIITAADCEGAGEQFQVTTTLPMDGTNKAPLVPNTDRIDYKEDFFGRKAFLTVSGQLAVEGFACALTNVYTFGPTFRAENSFTNRHLAEFWMVEPEMAFATLDDVMTHAELYTKHCVRWALKTCKADIEELAKMDTSLLARLEQIADPTPFRRVTYTEAIEILKQHVHRFTPENQNIYFGLDLATEHERFLSEKVFKAPIIVFNYPAEFKAFYMRKNPDGKTVQAMDMLVPQIGELIGGSAREERPEVLKTAMIEKGLNPEDYSWYFDLRNYGTVPHGGFGLGFERLIMLVTGINNIRDTIPYPRYPGNAQC